MVSHSNKLVKLDYHEVDLVNCCRYGILAMK